MLKTRVIPTLLLRDRGLVKTVRFSAPRYVGDPINAIKIFNDKEVDELVILDIDATAQGRSPRLDLIGEFASECFMPLGYGGGITSVEQMRAILQVGVEKVVLNSAAIADPGLVEAGAREFGSSSVVVSIDAKRKLFGGYEVLAGGHRRTGLDPVGHARRMVEAGAGELFLNSVDRDGTGDGYDLELTRSVADAVDVPVIACGGARTVTDFRAVVEQGHASAVAAGSMFVFHGKHRAVLISYPTRAELGTVLP